MYQSSSPSDDITRQGFYIDSRHSKFEAACKIHRSEGVIPLLYLAQPLHIVTINLLQWGAIQRVVSVMCRVLQVLAILDPSLDQRVAQCPHLLIHQLVMRLVIPPKVEARWEDGSGAVWRVRRWSSMGENVVLERIKAKEDQCVLVVLDELVTPRLVASRSVNGSPRDHCTRTLR
jgi:hypothetical protein